MRFLKLTLIALFLPVFMVAQKTEVGLSLGLSTYQGDLVEPSFSYKDASFSVGGLLKHHLNTKLALRAGLNFGKIQGDDANFDEKENRGYSFESNIINFHVGGEYTFLAKPRYDDGGTFQKTISPYIFVALGFVNSDVTVPSNIQRTPEEVDASSFHFSLPVGLGLKADLSERITLGIEATLHATFTDYLDGFSESANSDEDDWYFFSGATLTYRLGKASMNSAGNGE